MSYGPPNDPNQPSGQPQQPPQGGYQQQPPQNYQQPPPQGGYQQPPPQAGYQQPQSYQPPPQAAGQGYQVPSAQNLAAGFQGFSLGRKLFLGAGLLSVIMFFLPWYTVSYLGETLGSASGLRGLPMFGWILLLVALVAMALPLFGKRLRDIVQLPISEGQLALYSGAGVFAVALLGGFLYSSDGVSFGIGFWLALLTLAATAAGGWLMFQAKE